MKTALVIGASGFVGSHLVPMLKESGYKVSKLDAANGSKFEDWADQKTYDAVFHLGANIPDISEREKGDIRKYADIALDLSVMQYISKFPPREVFCYPSSCSVDSADTDPYAYQKQIGERLCKSLHKQGIPVVILRPFSGTGPGQKLSYPLPAIIDRAMKREDPLYVWGSLDTVRDWVYIDDLCRAFIWAVKEAPRGIPVEIGSGVGTSFGELAGMVANEVGYAPVIRADTSKPTSSTYRVAKPELAARNNFMVKYSVREIVKMCVEKWPWT